jgi:hypothetical protein
MIMRITFVKIIDTILAQTGLANAGIVIGVLAFCIFATKLLNIYRWIFYFAL